MGGFLAQSIFLSQVSMEAGDKTTIYCKCPRGEELRKSKNHKAASSSSTASENTNEIKKMKRNMKYEIYELKW